MSKGSRINVNFVNFWSGRWESNPRPKLGKPTPLSKPFKTRQEAEKAHTVGDHLLVTLSGGRIAKATVKAVVDTTGGLRLQVLFGDETGLNYLWQVV
jgi:hypothetical protein